MRRPATWLAALLAALAAGGCTSLGQRIAQPQGGALLDPAMRDQLERTAGMARGRVRTPSGVAIAYAAIPPAGRGAEYALSRGGGEMTFSFRFDGQRRAVPLRGTVVYLHGWSLDASSMLPWALALSERGYRGITVDLRNHGRSSRAPAGYGVREAADVAALLEVLASRGELPAPVYLFGVSYGAATALFAEPALRGRVAAIVAMESYANAGQGIRDLVAGIASGTGGGMRARLLRAYAGRRHAADDIDRGVREASERLQLDLDQVDVRAVLAGTATCTLLLHGAADALVPAAASRSLAGAAPLVRYRELPEENHFSLPLRIDWLASPLADWLQATADGACPELALPADPLLAPRSPVHGASAAAGENG